MFQVKLLRQQRSIPRQRQLSNEVTQRLQVRLQQAGARHRGRDAGGNLGVLLLVNVQESSEDSHSLFDGERDAEALITHLIDHVNIHAHEGLTLVRDPLQ